jgi:hypothetical protein
MGLPIPGFPSLTTAKQETKKRAVGQWDHSAALDAVTLPLGRQAELFAAGHFPIGKLWFTGDKHGTKYAGRLVPLATALAWLVVNATKKGLFLPGTQVRIHFCYRC